MSDLVREFFPDTPERCMECPGLEAAANLIAGSLTMASIASAEVELEEGENDQSGTRIEAASLITETFVEEIPRLQAIGRSLCEGCSGVSHTNSVQEEKASRRKTSRVSTQISACMSPADFARFIPPSASKKRS